MLHIHFRHKLRRFSLHRLFLPVLGLLSFLWFLVRVIPKPSRISYPCMRATFPLATGFMLWMGGLFSSIVFFKKFKTHRLSSRKGYALLSLVVLIFSLTFTLLHSPSTPARADDAHFIPTDPPNQPMGQARGIFPGRVVWAHNAEATSWSGTGYWWQDKWNSQTVVSAMLSQSLRDLTGASTDAAVWDALFHHFNTTHGLGEIGYQSGEKIAIKLNLNACNEHGDNRNAYYNSPHTVFALLQQLVDQAGVPAENITFYDATRLVPSTIYDKCKAKYPGVNFEDWDGGQGRKKIQKETSQQFRWSQNLTLEPDGGNPTYLPTCVAQADYLINLGSLKGHNLAGVTLNAKNLFGSIIANNSSGAANSSAPLNAGLHPYVCVHDDFHFGGHWDFDKRDMGTYNVLVDLLGHKNLGGKTMLFLIDGLYSAPDQSSALEVSYRWKSFGNDWPNSLFASIDPIAIESVCVDFLRNESVQTWLRGNIDNYLHEAALANNPPSGTVYDPERDGSKLASLGVHEHWNNATDKKYSRNLGTGAGIELVRAGEATRVQDNSEKAPSSSTLLKNYPNPFNAQTRIEYTLTTSSPSQLAIFDLRGARVKSFAESDGAAGTHTVIWDGCDDFGRTVASGVYWAKLTTMNESQSLQITLSK